MESATGATTVPVADRGGQPAATRHSGDLAYTGSEGSGSPALAALLAVLLGAGIRAGVRRSRQRS